MRLHPMPEFGSFTLLLALALSVYTLVMGGLALVAIQGLGGAGRMARRPDWVRRRGGRGLRVLLRALARRLRWCGLRLRTTTRSRTFFITRIRI